MPSHLGPTLLHLVCVLSARGGFGASSSYSGGCQMNTRQAGHAMILCAYWQGPRYNRGPVCACFAAARGTLQRRASDLQGPLSRRCHLRARSPRHHGASETTDSPQARQCRCRSKHAGCLWMEVSPRRQGGAHGEAEYVKVRILTCHSASSASACVSAHTLVTVRCTFGFLFIQASL